MPFSIVRNDITLMQVDASVNTTNPQPVIGYSVDTGIHQKAGHQPLDAIGGAIHHIRNVHKHARQQEQYGWEFLFLGANIDAAREAARFGIAPERAANYHADHQGTGVIYEAVSEAICQVRSCEAPLQANWKDKINADFLKRRR